MPADALTVLQASVTRTATLNGTGVDLKTGTPLYGLVAKIIYSAAATSAGSGSISFTLQESADNSTFTALSAARSVTLSTTAVAGIIEIPFETRSRYVRLALSAISGTDATVTYQADILLGRS